MLTYAPRRVVPLWRRLLERLLSLCAIAGAEPLSITWLTQIRPTLIEEFGAHNLALDLG